MYDGNPGEIDFGSSQREVRVTEGSSYRESTVIINKLGKNDLIKVSLEKNKQTTIKQ